MTLENFHLTKKLNICQLKVINLNKENQELKNYFKKSKLMLFSNELCSKQRAKSEIDLPKINLLPENKKNKNVFKSKKTNHKIEENLNFLLKLPQIDDIFLEIQKIEDFFLKNKKPFFENISLKLQQMLTNKQFLKRSEVI